MPRRNTVTQGTIYLAASSVVFVVSGYIMHSLLGRLLQPENYGIFGLVFSVLVWLEILFGGISGATVKMVAEGSTGLRRAERDSVTLLFAMGVVIFAVTFLCTPLLARAFNEPSISFYLKIALLDVPFLAIYRAYIALLNGMKLYGKQSMSAMVYVVTKSAFVVVLVLLGFSISGALVGNVVASVFGLALAFFFFRGSVGAYQREEPTTSRNKSSLYVLARAAVPFTAYALLYNAIMNTDLWLVQSLLSDSTKTGYYVAATNLARALYFILSALSLALFPAIAGSIASGDHVRTEDYIRRSFRTLFVILVPISIFMAVSSARLISFIYSSSYLASTGPLVILSFSYALFAILISCFVILLANNNFREVLIIEILLLALEVILCVMMIPRFGLVGAACATLFTTLLGSIACAMVVWRKLGISADTYCFLRTLAASILASAVLLVPGGGVLLMLYYALAGLIYLLLLWILGELGPEDLAAVKGLLNRG